MKTLLLFTALLMLSGCSDFNPMSEGEATAFSACLEKGLKPSFEATSSRRTMTCTRK